MTFAMRVCVYCDGIVADFGRRSQARRHQEKPCGIPTISMSDRDGHRLLHILAYTQEATALVPKGSRADRDEDRVFSLAMTRLFEIVRGQAA